MLKTIKLTAIAAIAGLAFSAPASAQDFDPAQAKTVADMFVKCAGVYGAAADTLQSGTDTESQNNHKLMKEASAGAQVSAMVLYVMAGESDLNQIDPKVKAERATYNSRISSEGLSDSIKGDLSTCFEMAELQKTLVDVAKEALGQ